MTIKIISLFNGMNILELALIKNGYSDYEIYYSEIKPEALKVTREKGINTIYIGDVTKVRYENGIIYSEEGEFKVGQIDLVAGGSPCQDLSSANIHQRGLSGSKSSLFFEYLRILEETKPKYFLLENVSSMKKDDKKLLDGYMKCVGKEINSLNFVPQNRKRLYWTNLIYDEVKNVREKNFQDILEYGYVPKDYSTCLLEAHSRPNIDKLRLTRRHLEKGFIPIVYQNENHYLDVLDHYNKHYRGLSAKEVDEKRVKIDNSIYEGVRVLNSLEMERLQGVPEGYTHCVSRNEAASLLGDGWTVDVIAHILKGLRS